MSNKEGTSGKHGDGRLLVPRLRFPEFRDAGEWVERILKDISPAIFDGTHQTPNYTPIGIPFFSVENLISGAVNKFISQEDFEYETRKNKPRRGDILLTRIGNIGYSKLIDWNYDFSIYVTLAVIRQSLQFNSTYLHFYFQSNRYQVEILSKSLLNAVPCKINMDSLRNTKVLLPSLAEQQKIADCLSSLDELIAAQTQKLGALKTHKKGLMQQLFPAEGETVPKLRFPEFRDAGEWEDKFIRDLGEIITGSTPSTTKRENYGGERLFVSPADISDQRFIEKTKTTLTELGFSETRPIKEGSILFVCIGSTIGKIAQNLYECATNQQINAVIPSAEHSNTFIYYSLENNSKRISELAGNHAVPIINKTGFSAVEIRFPRLPEQQKIADCLSSIDEFIAAQTQKLSTLKTHKKGLMQQLFPSVDEVNG